MSNPCSPLCRPACGPARSSTGLSRIALVLGLLAALAFETPGGAQFVLWQTQSVPNPFSVTTAVRGVTPSPSLKLEGLVGFVGAGNQFVYHVTPALSATSPTADLRILDTRQTVSLSDLGIQSAFNGLCCSNDSLGITDDSTLHTASNFGAGNSSEILIGNPELTDSSAAFGDHVPSAMPPGSGISKKKKRRGGSGGLSLFSTEGTISFQRIAVSSVLPPATAGLLVATIDGPPDSAETAQPTLTDCQGVATNWHFSMDYSPELDETFVSCVKTNGNFVLKRVEVDPDAVTEIPLVSGVGTTSSIFTYLDTAVCPISTGSVVGTVIARQTLGTTTFFATYLSPTGTVTGTSQVTLPGARANHQAFFCRSRGDLASFVYHGSGQTPTTTTDTFVVEVGETSLAPPPAGGTPLLVRRVTENRRTDAADAFADELFTPAGGRITLDYRGPQPVAEIQAGTSNNVRYGAIQVPLFFHNFESGDLRFFSSVAP